MSDITIGQMTELDRALRGSDVFALESGGVSYKISAQALKKSIGGATLTAKTITANGTYDPADDGADGYSGVTADVPNTYAAGDEGKVVANGALVSQTARAGEITENGEYDTTLNNSVTVNVSGGGIPQSDIIQTAKTKLFDYGAAALSYRSKTIFPPDSEYVSIAETVIEITPAKSHIVYLVAKAPTNSNRIISFWGAGNDYNLVPGFFNRGGYLYMTVFGSDTSTNISAANGYFACALAVDTAAHKARYYANAQFFEEKATASVTWPQIQINGTDGTYGGTEYIKHMAVVEGNEIDSDATIIANLAALMTEYGIS